MLHKRVYSTLNVLRKRDIDLCKYGVFVVELISASQSEEELAAIIMRSGVGHCNQPSAVEAQPGVKLILWV